MEKHEKSWWGRNWVWVVPSVGCLVIIIVGILGIAGLIFGATKIMSSSEPYQIAIEESMSNEILIELLGEPIETVGSMKGNISYRNGRGDVDISVPIRGPKGNAVVEVKGVKESDSWEYDHVRAIIEKTGDTINLLLPDSNGFQ